MQHAQRQVSRALTRCRRAKRDWERWAAAAARDSTVGGSCCGSPTSTARPAGRSSCSATAAAGSRAWAACGTHEAAFDRSGAGPDKCAVLRGPYGPYCIMCMMRELRDRLRTQRRCASRTLRSILHDVLDVHDAHDALTSAERCSAAGLPAGTARRSSPSPAGRRLVCGPAGAQKGAQHCTLGRLELIRQYIRVISPS